MKKKKKNIIIINGKEYEEVNTTFWDIVGGLTFVFFIAWLFVGSIGTLALNLLGLA